MNSSSEMSGIPSTTGEDTMLDKLGKPSYATYHIGGLPVHVFGLDAVKTEKVTVLFFLHGRLGRWEDSIMFIQQIQNTVKTKDQSLLVVTFDQRKCVISIFPQHVRADATVMVTEKCIQKQTLPGQTSQTIHCMRRTCTVYRWAQLQTYPC